MPSDAPVGEVFDIFGKMGQITLEILRFLGDRRRNKMYMEAQYGDAVKSIAEKHFGTGKVDYKKLLAKEGLENLNHKLMPAENLDSFEQIAKQVGLPFSVVNYRPDPDNPGEQQVMVAYSKNHEEAFAKCDDLVNARMATAQEVTAMTAGAPQQTIYEDVAMEAPSGMEKVRRTSCCFS